MRLPDWVPGVRAHRRHSAAWQAALETNVAGVSGFATRLEATVLAQLAAHGLLIQLRQEHHHRSADGTLERWLEMRFTSVAGRTVEIWIYPSQIDIHTPASDFVLEHWDSDTPEQAIDHVVAALQQAVK